jgi:hypothetical protein
MSELQRKVPYLLKGPEERGLLIAQPTSGLAKAVLTFDPKKNAKRSQSQSFSKDYISLQSLSYVYL